MLRVLPSARSFGGSARAGPSRLASPRISAISLGKRPVLAPRAGLIPTASLALGSRPFSWSSFGIGSAPSPAAPVVGTPQHDPILSSPHPDLQPAASASSPVTATAPTTSSSIPTESIASTSAPSPLSSTMESLPSVAATDPGLLPQSPAFSSVPTLEELVTNSGMSLSEVLHSPEAVHAAMKVSDLSLLGLEHGYLNLAGWVRDALVAGHTITGLPWWATIATVAVSFRLCLLPLIVRLTSHNVRLAAVQPQMTALFTRLNEAKAKADPQAQQVVLGTLQKLMKENDVSPFRPLLMPLVQMPFFLAFFYSLRKLADLPLPQLKEGGFGWVTDLTIPDPYFILPITSMVFTNLVLRVGADGTGATSANANMGHFRNALTIGSIIAIPFIGKMPAAVLFYWTFTNLYSLLQATLLRQPFVKSLLRIPSPPPPAPLPAGVTAPKEPTYAETWKALRETFSTKSAAWQEAKARHEASLGVKEREGGMRKGSALMVERVREKGVSPGVPAAGGQQGSVVPPPATASWQEAATTSERGGKEEIKARRVAAAREKRMRL